MMSAAYTALLVGLVACSSSGSSASVDGTVRGSPIITSTIASTIVTSSDSSEAFIVLSSTASCAEPSAIVQHPGEQTVLLILTDNVADTSQAPTGPGVYSIAANAAKAAQVEVNVLDATCGNDADLGAVATDGTVTLTSVNGGAFAGTFEVTLETGERITGSFDSDSCSTLADELHNSITPPCQP
jgi:hypothetical protein